MGKERGKMSDPYKMMLVRAAETTAEGNFKKEYMIKIFSYHGQCCLCSATGKPLVVFEGVLVTMLVS